MSSIPRSRSMTPQRSHTHPGHLSFTNIHAQSDATATASVPMANSYADPSRLRRIPKDSPPRARPASSVAGAINVAGTGSSGADFSGRLSMRFDNADRILEDPVIEARGDAATTSGTTHAMPNYPAMAPTSPAVGAPRPPPAAGRYSEDLTRVSRKDSPLYLEPQQDVPFNKSESHVSMSQMLLNSTKHVSLLKKKPSIRKHGSMRLGRNQSLNRMGTSEKNSRASSQVRSRSMESIRSMSFGDHESKLLEMSGAAGAAGVSAGPDATNKPAANGNAFLAANGYDARNSAFYVPVPTNANPTEVLALRFQAWRKILKDMIGYFRDIQRTYEMRSKLLLSASSVINNVVLPPTFLGSGGMGEANNILRDFHRQALVETNKAKEVEAEVILQLTGLRSDLQHKLKEIKNLSGDFKNCVEKEMEGTKKCVKQLQEALSFVDSDPSAIAGKSDPFIIRMGVDRQVERQLEEENYLHMAYLNLESSGRDLESIVVGEIQKAYNAYANILERDAELSLEAANRLKNGPVSLPKDHEWNAFVANNDNLVDPSQPVRDVANIMYPGRDHPATMEVRSGPLERKSKYLKSYTPGWYVLSPTHLHEFRSADRIALQAPVMSLYLPDQKLGSHSNEDSSSHKFMLKGRQTGSMHRGHAWVFRSENHETMLAWYEDIKNLTEKTGNDRDKFVKRHSRHMSSGAGSFRASDLASLRGSRLSMGTETAAATREPSPESEMGEDEADTTPYHRRSAILNSAKTSQTALPRAPDSTTTSLLVHARTTPHLTISPGPISTSPTSHPASMVASEPRSERGRFVSDVSAMHTDARDLDTSQLGTSMSSGDSVIGRGRDRDSLGDIPTMPGSRTSLDVPTGRNSLDIPSPVHPTRSRSSLSNRDTPISPTSPSFPSQSSSLHTPASRNDAGSDQHYTPPPQSVRTQPSMESTRRLYHARGSWSNEKVSNLASIPDADPPSSGKKDDPLEIEAPPPKPLKYRHTVPLAARETSPSKTSPASPLSIGPSSEKANSTHTTFYTPITSPPDASAVQSPQVERLKSGASTPATGATATATGPTESVTTIPAGSTNVSSIGAPVSSCTSYDSTAPRAKDDVGLATPTTPGASGAAERRSLERPMPQAPSPLRMHVESESPSQQAADDSAKHHG